MQYRCDPKACHVDEDGVGRTTGGIMGELLDFELARQTRCLQSTLLRWHRGGRFVGERTILQWLRQNLHNDIRGQQAVLYALRQFAVRDLEHNHEVYFSDAIIAAVPLALAAVAENATKISISPKQAVR